MRIGIVADDLTGAADSVAPFARLGRRARVAFAAHGHVSGADFGQADALAVTAGARDLTGVNDALRTSITRRLTRRLLAASPGFVYLKLDSTLRGRLRLELDAARAELPGRVPLVCPAFPANGRAVRGGVLLVNGVPWARSGFAPPDTPDSSLVPDAFGMGGEAGEIGLEVVRRGAGAVLAEADRRTAAGATALFADAETPDDLSALAEVILRAPGRFLPVGSAGMLAAVADLLPVGDADAAPSSLPLWQDLRARPVVVAVGSRNPVTLRQAAHLKSRAGAGGRVRVAQARARPGGAAPDLRRFGDRVLSLVLKSEAGALVLTGGETALGVLACFHAEALDVRGEIEPGVALASLRCPGAHTGMTWDGLTVVLKAGGFGDEATLARCVGL